jgi:hypothetical protein
VNNHSVKSVACVCVARGESPRVSRRNSWMPINERLTVVLWSSRHLPRIPFMYSPVMLTLLEGFSAAACEATVNSVSTTNAHKCVSRIIVGHGTVRRDFVAYNETTSQLVRGDIFIWVGDHVAARSEEPCWTDMGRRQVTRIFFNTEPVDTCLARNRNRGAHRRLPLVDELWDFSRHNVRSCGSQAASGHVTVRYIPIGATTTPGSRLFAELRRQPGVPAPIWPPPRPHDSPGQLNFVGDRIANPTRKACYRNLSRILGHKVCHTSFAWDEESFAARVLKRSDIFVNLHKTCGNAHNPVTWRNPILLNHGKLVLSERAHAEDEAEFNGMIMFFDNISAIASAYLRLLEQSGTWRRLAQAAHEKYRQHFQPWAILKRAGVYEQFGLLDTCGAAAGGCSAPPPINCTSCGAWCSSCKAREIESLA